jgi:DME family drug/metabolite transporter
LQVLDLVVAQVFYFGSAWRSNGHRGSHPPQPVMVSQMNFCGSTNPRYNQAVSKSSRGYLFILGAATLWASIGVFYKYLINDFGLRPLAAAALRGSAGGLILLATLLVLRVNLRIPRRDWPAFLAYGVIGVALFFVCYVTAIDLAGVGVAAVLMYTSPAWVAIISWRWMGERLGRAGLAALGCALAGAALVARIYSPETLRLNGWGVLAGLAAGLTYGLYSVFNKLLVQRHAPWVVQVYGLLIGAATLLMLVPKNELARSVASPSAILLIIGMGIIPTLLASLAFAIGVQWIPVSTAAIVAIWEPAVAVFFGYLLFGESLEPGQWLGIVCILAAVLLLKPGRSISANG